MGKRIISRARGHGGPAYRVRRKAFNYRFAYPKIGVEGKGEIINLINSAGHSVPIAKIKTEKEIFYIPAANGIYVGKTIMLGGEDNNIGNILEVKNISIGTRIFNIEIRPGDGGKMTRTSGGFAIILKKSEKGVSILMTNKKEILLNHKCRATIGTASGQGRVIKPFVTAGKKYFRMKSMSKLWPRTSAVKMNAVDHPFGGGRGKRIKSKIAKRNAPAGAKVGHISPRRTGKR